MVVDTNKNMENKKELKQKLEKELQNHIIEWNTDKEESPLRIKLKEGNEREAIKNYTKKWIKVLSNLIEIKPVQLDTQIRFKIPCNDQILYISLYGTGTVMFQGKDIVHWLMNNVDVICHMQIRL